MKIKRFFAKEVRLAMRQVRETLGADAVILSNRKVDGGIELVAAIDYDASAFPETEAVADERPWSEAQKSAVETADREATERDNRLDYEKRAGHSLNPVKEPQERTKPHIVWSQEPALVEMRSELQNMRGMLETQLASLAYKEHKRHHPLQHELRQRLNRLGIGATLAERLIAQLPHGESVDELWRRMLGLIAAQTPVSHDDILSNGGMVALVGPTGVGKTTTVAKLAARFTLRHGARSVALISMDNYRVAGHEQLRAYSRILGVPARFVSNSEELQSALDHFCDKRLVLIDTAGMSQRDMRLAQQFAILKEEQARVKAYLVLSTTSRLSGLDEVVCAFEDIDLQGCILTKLDESTCLGHALSVVIGHQLPVAYVADGQRVPEDLQLARAHSLVSRSVAVMQESAELYAEELMGFERREEVGA